MLEQLDAFFVFSAVIFSIYWAMKRGLTSGKNPCALGYLICSYTMCANVPFMWQKVTMCA